MAATCRGRCRPERPTLPMVSKIAFSATNPCHVYDLAVALLPLDAAGPYYSGYPRWRLKPPAELDLVAASARTLVTYGLLKLPERYRPASLRLFRWQDEGFDRAVARRLRPSHYLHGLPGQCRDTFTAARARGIQTVLNHASGPFEQQLRLIEPEYARAGVPFNAQSPLNAALRARIAEEMALADWHCVASSVVQAQLEAEGVDPARIWVVPYGADRNRFPNAASVADDPPASPGPFRICFAGQLSLRKGLYYLLTALEGAGAADWRLDCYGPRSSETDPDFERYSGAARVERHGPVAQAELGRVFREASVLVLPSAEEAFGLVVVQALQSGCPCIVSDRVGAKDLIRHRENGSIVPFGDAGALEAELRWWAEHPRRLSETHDWSGPARILVDYSERHRR